jgi:stage II sporulation protein D
MTRIPRRGAVAVAVVATVASGLTVSTTAGAASAGETQRGVTDDQLRLHGRGFGHGHGMSQYGAQGAARQGKGFREILAYYYPHTTMSRGRGKIRVLISADTSADVMVSPRPGLGVRNLGTKVTRKLPARAAINKWRIAPRSDGVSTVQFRASGSWHRWRRMHNDAEFVAPGPIRLWVPSGEHLVSRRYEGRLRMASPRTGAHDRDTVNVLHLDDYVRGVVAYEIIASWLPPALRAQAVAARTYAVWQRAQNRSRYYQICDTSSCQVYGGVTAEQPSTNAAVEGTKRRILRYHGKPAFTQFSASSGGRTAYGGMPYLPAKKDPYDGWGGNSYHEWTRTIDRSAVNAAYPALGGLRAVRITDRTGSGTWGGRVQRLVLVGRRSNVGMSGDEFQWRFGLPSTWFNAEPMAVPVAGSGYRQPATADQQHL